MQYNECKICGAKDGRAGMLISSKSTGGVDACLNCYDTLNTGVITIHGNLIRSVEELNKTFNLVGK